jgi:hypothetical protein
VALQLAPLPKSSSRIGFDQRRDYQRCRSRGSLLPSQRFDALDESVGVELRRCLRGF